MMRSLPSHRNRFLFAMAISWTVIFCPTYVFNSVANVNAQSNTIQHVVNLREYHNERYDFSFQYPAQWEINEALNGGGVTIAPKQGPYLPKIGVGGEVVQANGAGHSRTLEEDFESHLASMRKWRPHAEQHIRNILVQKKEAISFQGVEAIASTITYDIGDQSWVDIGIFFHTQDDHYAFSIELHCESDKTAVFQPVYDKIVQTFRILGPPK